MIHTYKTQGDVCHLSDAIVLRTSRVHVGIEVDLWFWTKAWIQALSSKLFIVLPINIHMDPTPSVFLNYPPPSCTEPLPISSRPSISKFCYNTQKTTDCGHGNKEIGNKGRFGRANMYSFLLLLPLYAV